ncbi:MAG: calcium/sodium antiporter [Vicinamibacteria bacterium]|jgi:cation:H+ antiporter|nr:calcium/sodium antiporter [Vicinamibacteria bacterium]MBP9946714.1 calcium/sodium antiporter [Vicinamibacteria bacterium]
MLESIALISVGLLLLGGGGEALLRGAVGLATLLRLSPAVIGLTVVAAGTSVPELSVSVIAGLRGQADIAVANAVGSNLFNIGFILGLCAMVRPLAITGNTIRLEYPVLAIVTLMCLAVSQDGVINWLDGTLFITVYVGFTAYMVTLVRQQVNAQESAELGAEVAELGGKGAPRLGLLIVMLTVGVVLLAFGAHATVTGAVNLARLLGMSERVIGLTIVAVGTSLPEIVASLMSSWRGRDDIAIGNVIGSNLFNILGILGLSSLVIPMQVHPAIVSSDNWWMLGLTLLLFPLMYTGRSIRRIEGALLMAVYLIYVGLLLQRAA